MRKIAVKITALILVLLSLSSTFISGAAVIADEIEATETVVSETAEDTVPDESEESAEESEEK